MTRSPRFLVFVFINRDIRASRLLVISIDNLDSFAGFRFSPATALHHFRVEVDAVHSVNRSILESVDELRGFALDPASLPCIGPVLSQLARHHKAADDTLNDAETAAAATAQHNRPKNGIAGQSRQPTLDLRDQPCQHALRALTA